MSHPPYSPNLPQVTFFVYLDFKNPSRGKCFDDVEEVKQNMAEAQKGIKVDEPQKGYHCIIYPSQVN